MRTKYSRQEVRNQETLMKIGRVVWVRIQAMKSQVRLPSCHSPICDRLSPFPDSFSFLSASSISGKFSKCRWLGSLKLQNKKALEAAHKAS